MLVISPLRLQQNLENATLECQQFLANIALCYQCERVSFEHQLLQCCWDILLEIELS